MNNPCNLEYEFTNEEIDLDTISKKLDEARAKLTQIRGDMHDRRWNALLRLWQLNADLYLSLCKNEIPVILSFQGKVQLTILAKPFLTHDVKL